MSSLAIQTSTAVQPMDAQLQFDDSVSCLSWNRDGTSLITAYASGKAQKVRWDNPGNAVLNLIPLHDAGITQLAHNPGCDTLATADEEGVIKLWDAHDVNEPAAVLQTKEQRWIDCLRWSADGTLLAAATANKITLYQDLKPYAQWHCNDGIGDISWSSIGKKLAIAVNRGLYLWTGVEPPPKKLLSFPGAAIACAWHSSAQAIAVGSQDSQLYFWLRSGSQTNTKGKAKQLSMRGYPGKVNMLAWHPKKLTAATAGGKDIVLWQLKTAKNKSAAITLEGHTRPVTALTYDKSGTLLASADRDGKICLWRDGICVEQFDTKAEITCLAWNPKGMSLAAGNQIGQTFVIALQTNMPD